MSFGLAGSIWTRNGDYSGKVPAPIILSLVGISIAPDGGSISFTLSKAVTFGAGGNAGFAITASGGAVTASYSSGDTTTVLVYSLSRTIDYGETVTVTYTQPGDGIEAVEDQEDVTTFTDEPVSNGSQVNRPSNIISFTVGIDITFNKDFTRGIS